MEFILISIIIIYIIINRNKTKETTNQINNYCTNCGEKLNNINNYCTKCGEKLNNNIYPNNNIQTKERKELTSQEKNKIKNSLILISGSILIVLSALIFLTSTWEITHNFLKTIIIVVMLGIFLGLSKLADKVFNLKETSKAFYYIALAYIPILFISISLFSLFGEYLSIYGAGKNIYLCFSAFLVSIIYYISAKKNNNSVVAISSIIFNFLGILFLTLIFTNNINIIGLALNIYNLIFIIAYYYHKYYYNNYLHQKVITPLTWTIITTTLVTVRINSIITILTEILILINLYYLLIKINNKEKTFNNCYPILIMSIFLTISNIIGKELIQTQLLMLLSFTIIYIINYLKNNKIEYSSYIEVLIAFIILYLTSFTNLGLNNHILLIIFLLLNTFSYMITDKFKPLQANILVITSILALSYSGYLYLTCYFLLALIIVSLLNTKIDKYLKDAMFKEGNIAIWLLTLDGILAFELKGYIWFSIYLLYIIISYIIYIKNKNKLYKYISYLYTLIAAIHLSNFININSNYFILTAIILITGIESFYEENKINIKNIYKFIFCIASFSFYKLLITDLGLSNITVLSIGSYLILLLAIIKLITFKDKNNRKIIEYIFSILINLNALSNFTNEFDSILYIAFLTILVIICYQKHLGPIFLTSLIFIIFNIIILTRIFWLSIPWWLYILLIGITLVGFAVYNEARAKNDSKLKEKVKEIKDNLEL